ncbi:BamA/TamA family outer membrane protein [Hymenobacter properus]|uniref:BamA/TamA family outer membrane protein n=1 Tax=Hymenobacter properus TaxID=2791026 RepID=A0A931BHS8_9BACT|nr:BamA/TamA family outer membrane protein [Hymenobacter properus]MBF9143809.1 BamA/TamA family outer membrane protein [Hymenobacter properus]MBR7722622.1 BamA/TamA family outer membrane protein [Microvirga sp. SRT04]
MRFPLAALLLTGLAFSAAAQPAAPSDTDSVNTAPRTGLVPLATRAAAQAQGSKSFGQLGKSGRLSLLPIPVLFYQAETGFGYGLGALLSGRFSDDTLTRPSNARLQYWTTQKGQSLLQLVHSVYTPGEKFYLNGEISAYDILLYYYGKGPNSLSADESETNYNLFIINQRLQKQIAPKLFFGAQYRFTSISKLDVPGNNLDNNRPNIFYTEPRMTERERQNTRVSGLGPVISYDTRDVPLAAFKGNLLDFGVTFNGTGLGSDYRFVRYQLDARHFQPLGSNRTILAAQFLGQFHTGDVPFRELAGIGANLGGTLYNNANLLRGIYEQRFRDRQMIMFQAEIRQKLFPNGGKVLSRFDAAVFGGVGNVNNYIDKFALKDTKYAGGAGIRFNFIRRDRVNLRLDYAGGTGSSPGILFAIGEAF